MQADRLCGAAACVATPQLAPPRRRGGARARPAAALVATAERVMCAGDGELTYKHVVMLPRLRGMGGGSGVRTLSRDMQCSCADSVFCYGSPGLKFATLGAGHGSKQHGS